MDESGWSGAVWKTSDFVVLMYYDNKSQPASQRRLLSTFSRNGQAGGAVEGQGGSLPPGRDPTGGWELDTDTHP